MILTFRGFSHFFICCRFSFQTFFVFVFFFSLIFVRDFFFFFVFSFLDFFGLLSCHFFVILISLHYSFCDFFIIFMIFNVFSSFFVIFLFFSFFWEVSFFVVNVFASKGKGPKTFEHSKNRHLMSVFWVGEFKKNPTSNIKCFGPSVCPRTPISQKLNSERN